ncbi:MAG: FAD-dependent tricarballylate dehydrogenase TcuA [Actinomycetia bacterium]|nr:FAD-dependent tricarballylate dehydrogenase TcuA [Actinomycetes bacterium]
MFPPESRVSPRSIYRHPPRGAPSRVAEVNDFDILVAGGGNAALCAALAAARAGARVLIVEAAPRDYRGGNSRHTRNMRIAHDEGNNILTGPYPVEEFLDDLLAVTGGNTNKTLARLLLEESNDMWDWMQEQGVRFQPSLEGTLSLGRTNAFFLGGGRALLNAMYQEAARLGVEVRYDTEVVDLDLDLESGEFRSATVQDPDGQSQITARAFVAASGGFESNLEWLEESWGPPARNFLVRGTPYNRGGVLRLLRDLGVDLVGDPKQCHAVAIDGRAPKFDGGIVTRLDCVPFGIVVNQDGVRFYDEGEDFWPKRYAIWGRLVAMQPGQVAHVLIDSQSINSFMPSVFPPERADSIEGLAEVLGLDPVTVRLTIDGFNAACRPGSFDHTVHDDCVTDGLEPPKSHWARPITEPPFYAYSLRPGITFTYLGTRIDETARMIMESGATSPNMFAAGEIMAGNILGQGYLAGLGMTIGAVFGRIAGREAGAHVS